MQSGEHVRAGSNPDKQGVTGVSWQPIQPASLVGFIRRIDMIVDIKDFLSDEVIEELNTKLLPDLTIVVNGDTLKYNGTEWELIDEKGKSAS